jgi:hypothetical protein
MEQLRVLVEGGVGVQQQQLRTLEEQLQAFLKFKDQVLSRVHPLLHHGVLGWIRDAYNVLFIRTMCRLWRS